jgi:hypothetical protein
MEYNRMMPVSLHEQVDEQAAAEKFHTIMLRAKDAVQQEMDRQEAEKKYMLSSSKGQSQSWDTQRSRPHLCAGALSMMMAPGFMVLHPFRVLCIRTGIISVLLQMCLQFCQAWHVRSSGSMAAASCVTSHIILVSRVMVVGLSAMWLPVWYSRWTLRHEVLRQLRGPRKRLRMRDRLLLRRGFWLLGPVRETGVEVVVVAGLQSQRLRQVTSNMVREEAGVQGVAVEVSLVVLGVAG